MPQFEAREYKILLDPERFVGEDPAKFANQFWRKQLMPAIAKHLDKRRGDLERSEGEFNKRKQRNIVFRDNADCVLSIAGYSLRERIEDGKPSQLTLKLRLPDFFLVASADQPGSDAEAETTFEEDIAPLAVAAQGPGAQVVLATPLSIRSRFSLSTSQPRKSDPLEKMDDVFGRFPTLRTDLEQAHAKQAHLKGKLLLGPEIKEVVFEGARVKLGNEIDGKFALTLWYFTPAEKPGVAEISFDCKFPTNAMPLAAARRAYDLFVGLQDDLKNWLELRYSSKTILALPAACAANKACAA